MAVYAIGDLHFSEKNPKPMDIFGWQNHKEQICKSWNEEVSEEDIVIIAGDTSWALKFEDAKYDLDLINNLKGIKIFVKGNHDYWWQSISKMKNSYPDFYFLHNNCVNIKDYIFFGTRGWICPNDTVFTEEDDKIFKREVERLKFSLKAGEKIMARTRIVVMHYPPVNDRHELSPILDVINQNSIDYGVYGHLHGAEAFKNVFEGLHGNTQYQLVSADYLNFNLKKICD